MPAIVGANLSQLLTAGRANHDAVCVPGAVPNLVAIALFAEIRSRQDIKVGKRNTWLEIVLDEGKNRHIRRMLAEFGIEVLRLIRIGIGPLSLGNLPKAVARPLTGEEKEALARIMNRQYSVPKD